MIRGRSLLLLFLASPLATQLAPVEARAFGVAQGQSHRAFVLGRRPGASVEDALGPRASQWPRRTSGDRTLVEVPESIDVDTWTVEVMARGGVRYVEAELQVEPPEVVGCTSSPSGAQP